MSEVEESHRIPAQQAAGAQQFSGQRSVGDQVVTNSDSSRSGPKGSKILTLLLASMALVIVAFAFVYLSRGV